MHQIITAKTRNQKFTCDLIRVHLFACRGRLRCSFPGLARYDRSWSFLSRDRNRSRASTDEWIPGERCLIRPGTGLCSLLQNIGILVTRRQSLRRKAKARGTAYRGDKNIIFHGTIIWSGRRWWTFHHETRSKVKSSETVGNLERNTTERRVVILEKHRRLDFCVNYNMKLIPRIYRSMENRVASQYHANVR